MGNAAEDILKQRINECASVWRSFLYFLSNYAYIEDKEKKQPMLFDLWPAQLRVLDDILNALLLIILKARQLGLTWLCAAYCLWYTMTRPMKLVVVISAKGDWAVEFLDRVYFILRHLPEWLYPPIEKQTSEILRFKHEDGLYSEIKSLTTTEAGAQSKTPDLLILDETCWNPYVREIYNASKPGIDAAGGRIIIISNSIKGAPGWGWTRETFAGALRGLNGFKHIFMSWRDRPGRPANFRELQVQQGMDRQDVIEHYPETVEEAIAAVSGGFFGDTLQRHVASLMPGVRGNLVRNAKKELVFEADQQGVLEVWRYPYSLVAGWDGFNWERRYAIGSDVSEGIGQSSSVAYVIDRKFDELVCRARSNRLDAVQWAQVLYDLSEWYHNSAKARDSEVQELALICAERTGAGVTTVKELEKKGANQYVKVTPGKVGSGLTHELGWSETEQKKWELCGDLKNWFRITKGGFYCSVLLDEASTTIKHEGTRRIGPEDDTKRWDCVVAAGCTIQASQFLEGPPVQIGKPPTGWLARRLKGEL